VRGQSVVGCPVRSRVLVVRLRVVAAIAAGSRPSLVSGERLRLSRFPITRKIAAGVGVSLRRQLSGRASPAGRHFAW
jgi:hypothetical protein